jgi:hypothetical protein
VEECPTAEGVSSPRTKEKKKRNFIEKKQENRTVLAEGVSFRKKKQNMHREKRKK